MGILFISHSRHNNESAIELRDWLKDFCDWQQPWYVRLLRYSVGWLFKDLE